MHDNHSMDEAKFYNAIAIPPAHKKSKGATIDVTDPHRRAIHVLMAAATDPQPEVDEASNHVWLAMQEEHHADLHVRTLHAISNSEGRRHHPRPPPQFEAAADDVSQNTHMGDCAFFSAHEENLTRLHLHTSDSALMGTAV